MKVEELKRNIHTVRLDVKSGWFKDFLFISDCHYDSRKCDRKLLKKHLDEAIERNAGIIIDGDWFDVMQGKYDPRGGKYDIRPEYKQANYLDCVINDAAEFLTPYAKNIVLIGQGNHETNILIRLETNIIERLVEKLNSGLTDHRIYMGGYSGWIKFFFIRNQARFNKVLKYHHGAGGNAKRSKGILSADIDQMQWPDADIIIKGHDHNKWYLPVTRDRLTQQGIEYQDTIHHIRLGSYKMLGDGFAGWETEKGFNTPRLGGWWCRFKYVYDDIEVSVTEAQ